jgi:hypothetical protein
MSISFLILGGLPAEEVHLAVQISRRNCRLEVGCEDSYECLSAEVVDIVAASACSKA